MDTHPAKRPIEDPPPSRPTPHYPTRRNFLARLSGSALASTLFTLRSRCAVAELSAGAATNLDGERVFRPSQDIFPNPERGFYSQRRSDRMNRLENLRADAIGLLLVTFDLRDFKDRALTDEKLSELQKAFSAARQEGLKIIFRAAYGFTGKDYRADPTDLSRITGHIAQIGAVLTHERDVLCGIQAGMLGPWGEWHGSNHGNPPSLEARRAVLFGWMDAVPAVTVHVRRPMFIRDIFATEPGGHELTAETAFRGSRLSRAGWHDDAFLVRPSDLGTYAERGWDRARELAWCNQHGRYTPFGGETVYAEHPMPVSEMIREMELLHATYLNIGYHPRVVQLWRDSEYQGENAFQHIARRLGYRFVADQLRYAKSVRAGAALPFELTLRNTGFASPHLPRVVAAGLLPSGSDQPVAMKILPDADPRWWSPEAGVITMRGSVSVPRDFPHGRARLGFRLADPSDRLRDDGRYAIRLANEDISFSAKGGWNILATDISV